MTNGNPSIVAIRTDGPIMAAALEAIRPPLDAAGRTRALNDATHIVQAIADCYEANIVAHEIGVGAALTNVDTPEDTSAATGLIYGRIQSGKTRGMILASALSFDNGFRMAVVVTSDNNRLVEQTHSDFEGGLPGRVRVYSKSHFQTEQSQARQILSDPEGHIVLVCSKGSTRLQQVIDFLTEIGAGRFPAIIFDDEGDQATLDTNVLERSTRDPDINFSRIHGLIHDPAIESLRQVLRRSVFVSVTGTPQAVVLQNIDSHSRPRFIQLLEPGPDYVGGAHFFPDDDPLRSPLVSIIDANERVALLGTNTDIPEGLKRAIRYFLLAASDAGRISGWPEDGTGFKLLCHPSVRTADHQQVAGRLRNYVDWIAASIRSLTSPERGAMEESYREYASSNQNAGQFEAILGFLLQNINSRQVLELNNRTTSTSLSYSRYYNFLIGGNTLGRGLAIKNLLVTYYVREARTPQMDTMYQHARMFGYRQRTLPYTKVFLPPQLYSGFREIYRSDEELRAFVLDNGNAATALPVQIARNLRPTRQNVLDVRHLRVLVPGTQVFPNYPVFKAPLAENIRDRVLARLNQLFPDRETNGHQGVGISLADAQDIVKLIKTNATNRWSDKQMPSLLEDVSRSANHRFTLKFRHANRTPGSEGLLATGVLDGNTVRQDAGGTTPVLWVFDMDGSASGWDGVGFVYPTLVLPSSTRLTVFNRS